MAKYDAGYLSPIKNKLGNAVGRRWRGIPVLAVYNGSPANPRTVAQQTQRASFSILSSYARALAPILMAGYGYYCKGKKQFPRAMFMKDNKGAVVATSPDHVVVTQSDMIVSRGSLPKGSAGTPQFDIPSTIDVTVYTPILQALSGIATGDFKVCCGAFALDTMSCVYENRVDMALTGGTPVQLDVPSQWNGIKVHVWTWVECATDKYESLGYHKGDCSESVYAGTGNIG